MHQYLLLNALVFDFIVGEVPNCIHPVVGIGQIIGYLRDWGLRRSKLGQVLSGIAIAGLLPTCSAFGLVLLVRLCDASEVAPLRWLGFILSACILKSSFSLRALGEAGQRMAEALRNDDLLHARHHLRSLCSRDPCQLDAEDLSGATIESLTENLCDSIVAPLFYFTLFGLFGALFYRVVNTLDAMIGYRGRYEYLGKSSARLDDVLNWIPARISVLLLLAAGFFLKGDLRNAIRVSWRDHNETASPNAGWSMATMAGMLQLELTKPGHYRLGCTQKLKRKLDATAIEHCWKIVRLASWMAFFSCISILTLCELPITFFGIPF